MWGEGWFVSLVVASVLANWGFGLAIGRTDAPLARRRWLTAAIVVNLLTLAVFKYANFAVANLNALVVGAGQESIRWTDIPLPLGISFFTFHAISYVVDVYKRNAKAERRLWDFALYILLFPQLIAGPIIRWRDFTDQISGREWRTADVAYGVRRFLLGLGKKVLIANTLGRVADAIFGLPQYQLTTPLAWLGLVCYTLQIYFDFSGYSDMAVLPPAPVPTTIASNVFVATEDPLLPKSVCDRRDQLPTPNVQLLSLQPPSCPAPTDSCRFGVGNCELEVDTRSELRG